jgi:hypothetical protein
LREKFFRKGRQEREGKQSQQSINRWVLGSRCVLCVLCGQKSNPHGRRQFDARMSAPSGATVALTEHILAHSIKVLPTFAE